MTLRHTLILAGGQSSRMGQDKALLLLNGVPLLRHLVNQVLPLAMQVQIITPWPERYRAIATDCRLIQEMPDPPQGPLVAFAHGLKYLWNTEPPVENAPAVSNTGDWVLLLACDLPQLTTTALQDWLTQLPPDSGWDGETHPPIAVLPRSPSGWEPLCGFYHRSCVSSLQAFIQTGGRSFQRWLQGQDIQELNVCDRTVLFNCNTPSDWEILTSGSKSSFDVT